MEMGMGMGMGMGISYWEWAGMGILGFQKYSRFLRYRTGVAVAYDSASFAAMHFRPTITKKLTIKLRTSNGVRRHVYMFIKLCLQLHM